MGNSAILSSRFRISIPKDVRQRLGLKAGQWVNLTPRGGQLLLEADPKAVNKQSKPDRPMRKQVKT